MKKKILLITYAFPPYATPESYLCSKLIGSLQNFEKDVLTLDFPIKGLNELDPSLNNYIKKKFNRIFRIKVPKIINFLSYTKIKNLFKFPDYFYFANKFIVKFINKNINLDEYSHVITWSQFHSIHLVGLDLKKSKKINWVTYFSDPWSDNPFLKSFSGFEKIYNLSLEKKVITNSDQIIYTSEETQKLVNKKYDKSISKKSFVIPHCFDPDLYIFNETIYDTKNSYQKDVCIFRYIGKFYGKRNPDILFKSLKQIKKYNPDVFKKIKFEIYGQQNLYIRLKLFIYRDLVKYLGPISYLSSLNIMRTADCLLVIDAPFENSIFFPSKLVDYMGAKKYVFGITPENGTASKIINNMGGSTVDPNKENEVYDMILSIYHKLKNNNLIELNDKYLNDHTSIQVSKKLNKILN